MAGTAEGATDATDLLRRTGAAYIRVAIDYPGHFAVMMQDDLTCQTDETLVTNRISAYGILLDVMSHVRDEHNPHLDVEAAATFCWSAIQGLVVLSPKLGQVAEDTGTSTAPIDVLIDQFATFMRQGMAAR